MFVNMIGIIGCALSIFPNFYVVMVGRFIYGGVAGIMFGLVPKMIMEYLSIEEFSRGYGLIPNLAIELFKTGFIILNFIYMLIEKDSTEDKTEDWYWMFNFFLPAPFMGFSIIFFGLFSRSDSFHNIMKKKGRKDAVIYLKSFIKEEENPKYKRPESYYFEKIEGYRKYGVFFHKNLPDDFNTEDFLAK